MLIPVARDPKWIGIGKRSLVDGRNWVQLALVVFRVWGGGKLACHAKTTTRTARRIGMGVMPFAAVRRLSALLCGEGTRAEISTGRGLGEQPTHGFHETGVPDLLDPDRHLIAGPTSARDLRNGSLHATGILSVAAVVFLISGNHGCWVPFASD